MKKPNVAVEVFLSLVKYFLIFIVINNLIWAGIHFGYFAKSFDGTTMSADMSLETGTQTNNQSITNG